MTADMSAADDSNRRSDVTTVLCSVGVLPWRYHGNDACGVFHWSVGFSDVADAPEEFRHHRKCRSAQMAQRRIADNYYCEGVTVSTPFLWFGTINYWAFAQHMKFEISPNVSNRIFYETLRVFSQ